MKRIYFAREDAIYPNTDVIFEQDQNLAIGVYVKTSLLIQYITAANWSSYSSKFIGYLDYTDTIPTFSGYTDQWYEDEDCTTPIATSAFVSGNRYFVKLTAI